MNGIRIVESENECVLAAHGVCVKVNFETRTVEVTKNEVVEAHAPEALQEPAAVQEEPRADRAEWVRRLITLRNEAYATDMEEYDIDRLWNLACELWKHAPDVTVCAPASSLSASSHPDQAPPRAGSKSGSAAPEVL